MQFEGFGYRTYDEVDDDYDDVDDDDDDEDDVGSAAKGTATG